MAAQARKPFIVLTGNIGVGKGRVAQHLAEELGLMPFLDQASNNPYLERFYQDQAKWALHSQLFFLNHSLRQHRTIQAEQIGCVQELSFYEHFLVMAHHHRDQGWITSEDFDLLSNLFFAVEDLLVAPHLLVLLETPVDVLAVRMADRPEIDAAYLARLDKRYRGFADSWIHSPVLRVNTEDIDIDTPAGLERVSELVMDRLGLAS